MQAQVNKQLQRHVVSVDLGHHRVPAAFTDRFLATAACLSEPGKLEQQQPQARQLDIGRIHSVNAPERVASGLRPLPATVLFHEHVPFDNIDVQVPLGFGIAGVGLEPRHQSGVLAGRGLGSRPGARRQMFCCSGRWQASRTMACDRYVSGKRQHAIALT